MKGCLNMNEKLFLDADFDEIKNGYSFDLDKIKNEYNDIQNKLRQAEQLSNQIQNRDFKNIAFKLVNFKIGITYNNTFSETVNNLQECVKKAESLGIKCFFMESR